MYKINAMSNLAKGQRRGSILIEENPYGEEEKVASADVSSPEAAETKPEEPKMIFEEDEKYAEDAV